MKREIRRAVNRALNHFGYRIVKRHAMDLRYQHDYGEGGYEEYRKAQVRANERKFDQVFADPQTLKLMADDIAERCPEGPGLCHGARNGWEIEQLRELTGREVFGTDISDSAAAIANMTVWDFHEENPEWVGKFAFVYTNSLDQAFDPGKALRTWVGQLAPGGRVYVEHTMGHSAAGASDMDPFGAHPYVMPYLLFDYGRGSFRLVEILRHLVGGKKRKVWLFVLEPLP